MADTIAAVATGSSAGGIGVIRISGDGAVEVAEKVFKAADGKSLSSLKGYTAKFGSVYSAGEEFDNAVALVFKEPKSYTGENVVELSVHGGIFIVEKTLEAVFAAGARPAEAGEFTKRAFLNGKIDLAQAEAVATMISAQGQEQAKASYKLLKGALSDKISQVLERLVECSASMAAWVDYPDEEIPELQEDTLKNTLTESADELEGLIKNYENGAVLTQGVDTAIVGKPNAGKSTLMNLLSGMEKSIVTHIEGTTRDVVENSVRLGGLVLHLADTAGIRESDDVVEAIGIKKALERIESASLVLAVFDSSAPLTDDDRIIIKSCEGKNAIAVINKTDLESVIETDELEKQFADVVYISAKNGDGAVQLEAKVRALLGVNGFDDTQPLLANKRQKACVLNALENVRQALDAVNMGITYDAVNVMIDSAVDELLALTGKKATQEVVNNIFSRFCVGK